MAVSDAADGRTIPDQHSCPHVTNGTCSICQSYADLQDAVREMRRLQRMYFGNRDPSIIQQAKDAERYVDKAVGKSGGDSQSTLEFMR